MTPARLEPAAPRSRVKQSTTEQLFVETVYRRVAETQIFEKTYLIVIKDETGLKLKINV